MTRVAIIAAMPRELKPFLDSQAKEGWVYERRGDVRLWRLIWPDNQGECVAACAGAGQAAATRAFAEVERDGPINSVVSAGWAGALNEEFAPGQAYLLSGVVDAQTGERFTTASHPNGYLVVTNPTVANKQEKQRLATTYGAGLVDMEAAAIARLAQMRAIPFYCVKGISDGYRDQLPDFNRFILPDGEFKLVKFVLFAIMRPWHWRALVRMGENSRRASKSIAESLLGILNQ